MLKCIRNCSLKHVYWLNLMLLNRKTVAAQSGIFESRNSSEKYNWIIGKIIKDNWENRYKIDGRVEFKIISE